MSDDSDETEGDNAPGWEAIDAALDQHYEGIEPMHWGTILPYNLGGEDPLYGVSVYQSFDQQSHLHYVTYGFSDLYEKENDDPEVSGFGFELTFRLAANEDVEPPVWVVNFLQNVARYVFQTGNALGPGHTLPLNSPICLEMETLIRTVTFVEDPQLGTIETPHGRVQFLQVLGLTDDELDATQYWNASRFSELMQESNPLLITDLTRQSSLTNRDFVGRVQELSQAEGASASIMCTNEFRVLRDPQQNKVVLAVGAIVAPSLGKRLLGRIPFGREFRLVGEEDEISFKPGDEFTVQTSEHLTEFTLTDSQTRALSEKLLPKAGQWTFADPQELTLIVEKTEIKDKDGNITDVLG